MAERNRRAMAARPVREVVDFMRRIERVLEKGEAAGHEESLVASVVSEVEGDLERVGDDVLCSRVLERVLALATDVQLRSFAHKLSGLYIVLCGRKCGSHLVQTVVHLLSDLVQANPPSKDHGEDEGGDGGDDGDEGGGEGEGPPSPHALLVAISQELSGNWVNLMFDAYATHVARSVLHALVGLPPYAHAKRSQAVHHKPPPPRPDDSTASNSNSNGNGNGNGRAKGASGKDGPFALGALAEAVASATTSPATQRAAMRVLQSVVGEVVEASHESEWDEVYTHPHAAAALQSLLLCLFVAATPPPSPATPAPGSNAGGPVAAHPAAVAHHQQPNTAQKGCAAALSRLSSLLLACPANHTPGAAMPSAQHAHLHGLATSRVGSRLVEALTATMPRALWADFLSHFLLHDGAVAALARDPFANFVVQRAVERGDAPQTKSINHCLLPAFATLLAAGQPGVVAAALAACARHGVDQKQAYKALVHALGSLPPCEHPAAPKAGAPTLQRLLAVGLHAHSPNAFPVMGSMMAQSVLAFDPKHSQELVKSFLACDDAYLVQMATSPSGARVWEALVGSDGVEFGVRASAVGRLKGRFLELARSRPGARVVEVCYRVSNLKTKENIASELFQHMAELAGSPHGQFVVRTCKLSMFKDKHEQWAAQQAKKDKTRELFGDLLEGDAGKQKAPSKPKLSGVLELGKFDPQMQTLGFGRGVGAKGGELVADEDEGDHDQPNDEEQAEGGDGDGNDFGDEIEALFRKGEKKTKKKKRRDKRAEREEKRQRKREQKQQQQDEGERKEESAADEANKDEGKGKGTGKDKDKEKEKPVAEEEAEAPKLDESLAFVMDAITGTRKKKKKASKKRKADEGEDEGDSNNANAAQHKHERKKSKRSFVMS